MYDINKIKSMTPAELKEASAEMERELGVYVLKTFAVRVTTALIVRWAIRRFL